ncbi:MAG: DUF433 domain-containing protein [Pseudonocardiaceae bacterium]
MGGWPSPRPACPARSARPGTLRQRIAQGARRDEALVGKVEHRRGALGNKPLLAGTRVPVETVQRYLAAGRSTDDVLEAFPMLTAGDVEAVRRETVA